MLPKGVPLIKGYPKSVCLCWHEKDTGKNCKMEKLMKFLKDTGLFEDI